MPDTVPAYDETRVFMEGVKVDYDPHGREPFVFTTYSVTVDGRVLRGILTAGALEESYQSIKQARAAFWRDVGPATVLPFKGG